MRWLAVLLPAAVLIALILSVMVDLNLNFDEGYNLQIPLHLARDGRYGAETLEGFRTADPMITTGPLLLVPIAPVLALTGTGIVQARVIPAVYALALVGLLAGLAWRLYGQWAAGLALGLLLMARDVIVVLGLVLGEAAGLVWWLAGLLVLKRALRAPRPASFALAGITLALAVWAKPSMAAATLSAAVLLLGYALLRREPLVLLTAGGAALGTALWFLFPTLIGQPQASLFGAQGAGLIAQQVDFNLFVNLSRNSLLALPTLWTPILVATTWRLLTVRRQAAQVDALEWLVITIPLLWAVWWLAFNRDGVLRHALPGMVLGILPLVAWAVEAGAARWRLALLSGVVMLLLATNGSGALEHLTQLDVARHRRLSQLALAERLDALPADARVYGWGWYLAWDVAFLAQRTLGDLQALTPAPAGAYVVITPTLTRNAVALQALNTRLTACQAINIANTGQHYELWRLGRNCP